MRSRYLPAVLAIVFALAAACSSGGDEGGTSDPDEVRNAFDGEQSARPIATYAYPVEMFPDEAPVAGDPANPRHVNIGEASYATDPPTSGPHFSQLLLPGVTETVTADEVLVHNMEHGYVVVWYNCAAEPTLTDEECATLRNDLAAVVAPRAADNVNVVMVPDTSMPTHIGLTAWQFLDAFDDFDEQRVVTFIDTFECRYDLESTCDG